MMTPDERANAERRKAELGEAISRRYAFFQWFDANADGYRALTDYLSTAFGAPFALTHTGGGCLAIECNTLEGNIGVMITDADDTLSQWCERRKSEHNYGYAVGVYRALTEHWSTPDGVVSQRYLATDGDTLAFVTDHDADTPDDVSALVARALSDASKGVNA